MDSWPIAHTLEAKYPTPSLHLDDPIVVHIRDFLGNLIGPIFLHVIPKVVYLLNEPSAAYFYETREKMFGAPLLEVEKSAPEDGWEKVKAPAKEAGDLLRKNGGPYFLGKEVSYADFIFVTFLHMMKRVDEKVFERYLALDEAFPVVYDACKEWLVKED